jgi:predicted dehydrogenase
VSKNENDYGLSPGKSFEKIPTPSIEYLPSKPKNYNPKIALIGTGGISEYHLKAYQKCGFQVTALVNRASGKAKALRDKYFPEASVHEDFQEILTVDEIEVIDVTPHPSDRLPILYDCLNAGKHVLSQKPFVLDVNEGRKLADLADRKGVKIAINQNGRWSPHFSYMRNAIEQGLIGEVASIDFSLQWDQTWITGIPNFEKMDNLILFDFAIHWFDITACMMRDKKPNRIYASTVRHARQSYKPPALASVIIDYPETQVRMSFNGHCTKGEKDATTIVGTAGTLRSHGPGLNDQPSMEIHLQDGSAHIPLEGSWFESGFQGTMCELLCSIEEGRDPYHSARNNLQTLELCFAAEKSVKLGKPVNFSNND